MDDHQCRIFRCFVYNFYILWLIETVCDEAPQRPNVWIPYIAWHKFNSWWSITYSKWNDNPKPRLPKSLERYTIIVIPLQAVNICPSFPNDGNDITISQVPAVWYQTIVCSNGDYIGTYALTHWGRVTHICVSKLTTIGSDNDLSSGRREAIIWTSAGILWIGPLGTNFSENLIGIQTF